MQAQAEQLEAPELEKRLAWLQRQARAGIAQRLVGFLGPETLVLIEDHQILVRRYAGVQMRDV